MEKRFPKFIRGAKSEFASGRWTNRGQDTGLFAKGASYSSARKLLFLPTTVVTNI